jgi:hypothetical protein
MSSSIGYMDGGGDKADCLLPFTSFINLCEGTERITEETKNEEKVMAAGKWPKRHQKKSKKKDGIKILVVGDVLPLLPFGLRLKGLDGWQLLLVAQGRRESLIEGEIQQREKGREANINQRQ